MPIWGLFQKQFLLGGTFIANAKIKIVVVIEIKTIVTIDS